MSKKQQHNTHDYSKSNRHWGHDYVVNQVFDSGKTLDMMGWGRGIVDGDYIIIDNKDSTTRYQIKSIEYYTDPRDMWKATAEFAPRPEPALTTEEL